MSMLEVKDDPFHCPKCAYRFAVEDGEESHDNHPHRNQSDHAMKLAQEMRVLEDASV
jgi:hypothetical protein